MTDSLDAMTTTCWRECRLRHPVEWELTAATPVREVGRLVFADRRRERLKVQWRPMPHAPRMDRMMESKAQRDTADRKTTRLSAAPPGWHGLASEFPDCTIVHAGSYDPERCALAELIFVWPDARNEAIENGIMASLCLNGASEDRRVWQAMGLRLRLDARYELFEHDARAGRVTWRFGLDRKHCPLSVSRIGIPDYWLASSVEEWLVGQLQAGEELWSRNPIRCNGHDGVRVVSARKGRALEGMRGLRRVQVDEAWLCETENRVYHVQYGASIRGRTLAIPGELQVDCCRPADGVPLAGRAPVPGRSRRVREATVHPDGEKLTAMQILESVPVVNQAARFRAGRRGGVLVEIPMQKPWYIVPPLSWVLPYSRERRVTLDALGEAVLDLCRGGDTVEGVIDAFAARHRLTFREAQLPVMQFLRMLLQRGVIALAGPGATMEAKP